MRMQLLAWLLLAATIAAPEALQAADAPKAQEKKTICFVAGRRSHRYAAHEHYAGCVLLAKAIQKAKPGYTVRVFRNGWPQDPGAFAGADTVVMYADGGGRHPVIPHLKEMDAMARRGVGVVCIHYGVEVPKGEPGDKFLDWIGGYFETHWSVNPHWTAEFKTFGKHPITRGVKPFTIHDEWYYHMRFREGMKGVTPILTAIPPKSTLSRPDGPHSGNPHVRRKAGQPQHVAWASERPDGGRGFGFTGGHVHWNWGDDNFRRVVLNAIVWTAHGEIPPGGIDSKRLTVNELLQNQDYKRPANFDPARIEKQFGLPPSKKGASLRRRRPGPRPIFATKVVTPRTPGQSATIDVDISGKKQLYLVASDAGNGYSCDWADWVEPKLIGPRGEVKLTELKWRSAEAGFGAVRKNANCQGRKLQVAGKPVAFGIGTHANSVIAYDLPPGYTRFVARGALDDGGARQGACGRQASVQFLVYDAKPASAAVVGRDPEDAVAGLDVAKGLEATLFASEPRLLSLTNLDIDHRGRVWVCEVVNYRRHNGKRKEGDRILILEDTDGDGRADKSKVFYQGRDIDSAMGICVLGNRVIVSASPTVWVFTDEDGDDKPDRKEALFTKTGQPQHDHSAHSFLFGPDGKLYWNFGNTGKAVHDRYGKPVVDMAGNRVIDNGRPYFGGMPFRCNLDGSQFEVLAHNFRNNYEVTVDSFGTLWQSDNDDDGNRGVRINFVMEYGNYGYKDEITGAGWRSPRTGMHEQIPLRHWHLRDPGVVPNLLQTGAGSPTGITVYEGRLLPKVFWDQVIHCDAGPNIVRCYPAQAAGAGYTAKIANILHGARDKWFRPADVCVAPDGSLFVTDWYDPGVGGHNMRDLERGRLFRIAPPKTPYRTPKFDFETAAGAVEALKNPALSVRYMAWTALDKMGVKAEDALAKVFRTDDNPRLRARALWLLARLPEDGRYLQEALRDRNPDLRICGLRATRRGGKGVLEAVRQLVKDPSAAVRRECCVALRHEKSDRVPELWAELAQQHNGKDRWYLEALGIAATGRWDACLEAWLERVGNQWNSPAGKEIVWRSRGKQTPDLLAKLIQGETNTERLQRYFRAFDFLSGEAKQAALLNVAFSPTDSSAQALIAAESAKRLSAADLTKDPARTRRMQAMLKQMERGAPFIDLVAKFSFQSHYPDLLAIAQQQPTTSVGVKAIRTLLDKGQRRMIRAALQQKDVRKAAQTALALSNSADGRATGLLLPLVSDNKRDLEVRRQATRAVARTPRGAEQLLRLAETKQLDPSLKLAAAFNLNNSRSPAIRAKAAKLFPLPPTKDQKPLPPIRQLVGMSGNAAAGKQVFAKTGQCAKCHVVNGEGKEVGPNLSEIGAKLSRQALHESILFPSAGVSHNYETWSLQLASGLIVKGILVTRTEQAITIKSEDGIARTYKMDDVDDISRSKVSLMPADLQKTLSVSDLVNVVEYLTTLKKARKTAKRSGARN